MDKIQELTSKLYSEGVEKGKEEADKIIAQAKASELNILSQAQQRADTIIAAAQKEAKEFKKNTESELKLYTAQATEALKTEITNLVSNKLTSGAVKEATKQADFMEKLITNLVENWSKTGGLNISVANADELKTYISANAKNLLDKGLKIETVNGIDKGFELSPEDGTYRVKFGEQEFVEYFKAFFRPQIRELLFD